MRNVCNVGLPQAIGEVISTIGIGIGTDAADSIEYRVSGPARYRSNPNVSVSLHPLSAATSPWLVQNPHGSEEHPYTLDLVIKPTVTNHSSTMFFKNTNSPPTSLSSYPLYLLFPSITLFLQVSEHVAHYRHPCLLHFKFYKCTISYLLTVTHMLLPYRHYYLFIKTDKETNSYSFVAIDIDLDYVMCLVLHLMLIILLESIARKLVTRAGWQQHSFC